MSATGSSSEVAPSDAIKELLNTADTSVWGTAEDPVAFKWHERSQQERGPGDGMPPELYIWQPTSAPLNRLTADNALLTEEPTAEIWVYSLSEADTKQLARDVIHYMSEFMSENYQNTEFADIVPSNVEDFREQKLQEQTNHFTYMVEVELSRETETGIQ